MGDNLFSGLSNVRFPDSRWNVGPLPDLSMVPGNTFDAKYNYGDTLLGDLNAYSIGTADRVANQVSYINKPHSIQKVIPKLHLPKGQVNSGTTFPMSHPVDDSDLAFTMRLDKNSFVCTARNDKSMLVSRLGTSIDPMINLVTVNYLLAGFQLCYTPGERSRWADLLHHLDKDRFPNESKVLCFDDIRHIIRELIRPFGIVRGSEKQGGQNEVGYSPATWPISFVTNMTLDGHERNVTNYWHFRDISAGDDLVLRLKPMPLPRRGDAYTLNHYYKEVCRQDFDSYYERSVLERQCNHVWQLAPDIFDLEYRPENCVVHDPVHCAHIQMPPRMTVPKDYVWQSFGYWHIGRAQIASPKYGTGEFYYNDLGNNATPLRTTHMDMTFQPSWHQVPGEPQSGPGDVHAGHPEVIVIESRAVGPSSSALRSDWRVMPRLPSPPRRLQASETDQPQQTDFRPLRQQTDFRPLRQQSDFRPLRQQTDFQPLRQQTDFQPLRQQTDFQPLRQQTDFQPLRQQPPPLPRQQPPSPPRKAPRLESPPRRPVETPNASRFVAPTPEPPPVEPPAPKRGSGSSKGAGGSSKGVRCKEADV